MRQHLHLSLILSTSTLGVAHWEMDLLKVRIIISSCWEEHSYPQVIIHREGLLVLLHSGVMNLLMIEIITFCWEEFGKQQVIINQGGSSVLLHSHS
jgi:hypothetical protein